MKLLKAIFISDDSLLYTIPTHYIGGSVDGWQAFLGILFVITVFVSIVSLSSHMPAPDKNDEVLIEESVPVSEIEKAIGEIANLEAQEARLLEQFTDPELREAIARRFESERVRILSD